MSKLDQAESKAKEIFEDIEIIFEKIKSEEDTKIQIINRVLTECLGWSTTSIRAESHHENGFSDYIIEDDEKPILLIEAKRIGVFEIDVAEKNRMRNLKISGTGLKGAMKGIDQAFNYSSPNGIPITVLTDGISWVIFKTFITNENYKDKKAIVFPSLNAILNNFSNFYDLLAIKQVKNKVYNLVFDQLHNERLILTQDLEAPLPESSLKLTQKSPLAFDLNNVFESFFTKLSGSDDDELLVECFVETQESRIADFSLEKMTTNVLGNITAKDSEVNTELTSLIESNVSQSMEVTESGKTAFIVGPTGSGKTTFLHRFFSKTLPGSIRKKCILVNVNFLDSTGIEENALNWLTEQVITAIEEQIYEKNSPNWDQLLGLYYREYEKRREGVDAALYKRDKQEFKEKFGEFLDEKVEKDREGYLKKLLFDVVFNRKKLPILVIDNTDEFSSHYKQMVFQFAQSLRRYTKHCLLFFPVTDKSAWSFSKTDIFGIYKSKSFFLPTPSPKEVFRKRINYLKLKISEVNLESSNTHKNYFTNKGVGISINNIERFAQILDKVFVDNDYTSKTIGELSNYNIRRTLILSQRVITSPVLKIEDLVKSYLSDDALPFTFSKFIDALIRGDYEAYKQGDNNEIYPVFQVDNKVKHSPLLILRILTLLDYTFKSGLTVEEKHCDCQSIIDYFVILGCNETALNNTLLSLLDAKLIEPFDLSVRDLSNNQKFAISKKGAAHLRLASHNPVFFYQMALTTAITNTDVVLKIKTIYRSTSIPFGQKTQSVKNEFLGYLIDEDSKLISIDIDLEQYDCQKELLGNLKNFSNLHTKADDMTNVLGQEYGKGTIKKEVLAIIDFFDQSKKWGFASVEEIESDVFVHLDRIKEFGEGTLLDGDVILCDLARNDKGLFVEKIHDIQTDRSKVETVECKISRLFEQRGYGFVELDDKRSAFFHLSVFPQHTRSKLNEGKNLTVDIGPDRKGDGYQVKCIRNAEI